MTEKLSESKDFTKETVNATRVLLSLLEKETWTNFFKKAWNWLKYFFGSSFKKKNKGLAVSSTKNSCQNNEKIESSNNSKNDNLKKSVDKSSESKNNINDYKNKNIPDENVKKARNYIVNWWTFHSNSKWTITWGKGEYKHVCSTWSFNVLWKMGLPKVSNSTECDLKWKILPKMGFKYICVGKKF